MRSGGTMSKMTSALSDEEGHWESGRMVISVCVGRMSRERCVAMTVNFNCNTKEMAFKATYLGLRVGLGTMTTENICQCENNRLPGHKSK